jgi:hypothetical protein
MTFRSLTAAAALLSTLAVAGVAGAQTVTVPGNPAPGNPVPGNPQTPVYGNPVPGQPGQGHRNKGNSTYNIEKEYKRLSKIIGSLQHDARDYGGHRARAVDMLRQAQTELEQAVEFDRAHPGA